LGILLEDQLARNKTYFLLLANS